MKNTSQYLYLVKIENYPTVVFNREKEYSLLSNFSAELNIVSDSVDECLNYVREQLELKLLSIKEKHGLSPAEKYKITDCSNQSKVDVLIPAKPFVPFIV